MTEEWTNWDRLPEADEGMPVAEWDALLIVDAVLAVRLNPIDPLDGYWSADFSLERAWDNPGAWAVVRMLYPDRVEAMQDLMGAAGHLHRAIDTVEEERQSGGGEPS